MTVQTADSVPIPVTRDYTIRIKRFAEALVIPIGALIVSALIFSIGITSASAKRLMRIV